MGNYGILRDVSRHALAFPRCSVQGDVTCSRLIKRLGVKGLVIVSGDQGERVNTIQIRERVLVVEDEVEFGRELCLMLERYGFDTRMVHGAGETLNAIGSFRPTILVLDQFVQNFDMLPFLREIRRHFNGGVMILTGNADPVDKIIGLELGADDFVVKTTEPREIVARLRALARRRDAGHAVNPDQPTHAASVQKRDGWFIDRVAREIRSPDGIYVPLTGLEFDTFLMLFHRPGEIVSRDDMAEHILERNIDATGRSIENLVSRVRVKFKPVTGDRPLIKSVRGKGYAFLGFG